MHRTTSIALVALLALAGPAAAAGVSVTLAQDRFAADEPVEFWVSNETPDLIQFGSSAPYTVKNTETGQVIPFVGLAVMIPLEPGATQTFTIRPGDLAPAPYELVVTWFDKNWNHVSASATFTVDRVDDQTPAGASTVGRTKGRYRER